MSALPSRVLLCFSLAASVATQPGCAVVMAVRGTESPNVGGIAVGQDRAFVLATLGEPEKTLMEDGGKTDLFKLKVGEKPSPGRAMVHGIMDFLTLGVWEIIGTPIEMLDTETFRMSVQYDVNGRVVRIMPGNTPPSRARDDSLPQSATAIATGTEDGTAETILR